MFNSDDSPQQQDDAAVCIFDADQDDDPDIYLAAGGYAFDKGSQAYSDRLFLNDGKGFFEPAGHGAIPVNLASKGVVKSADLDNDGLQDLFIGGRVLPGMYPEAESGFIYRNETRNGKVAFRDMTDQWAPELKSIGMITDAAMTDVDNDKDDDLIVTGEWMGILIFKNEKGRFRKSTTNLEKQLGWWNSLAAADIDKDGDMDFVAGNYGLNGFYRAGEEEPIVAYANDYDDNGRRDLIMSQYRAKEPHGPKAAFPVSNRDAIVEELPGIKKYFNTYSRFAKAEMPEVLGQLQRKNELVLKAHTLQTVWIENKGSDQFLIHALPDAAQWSTVYGLVVDDFNGDGNADIALNGNEYGSAPIPGRTDAMFGLILKGDGRGNFNPLSIRESGFFNPSNGKALIKIKMAGKTTLVAANNSGPLKLFQIRGR